MHQIINFNHHQVQHLIIITEIVEMLCIFSGASLAMLFQTNDWEITDKIINITSMHMHSALMPLRLTHWHNIYFFFTWQNVDNFTMVKCPQIWQNKIQHISQYWCSWHENDVSSYTELSTCAVTHENICRKETLELGRMGTCLFSTWVRPLLSVTHPPVVPT